MKKIIHVDNSVFFRKLVRTFLKGEGFEVSSFESAQDANMAISSEIIHMVIMGLAFADIEGKEFLKKIVDSFTGPIIVISSSVDQKMHEELVAQGITAAINKSGPWQQSLMPYLTALKQA